MKHIIPIFPLNIVMFPGSKYPLHIFEERYKKMVNNSIASGDGFGIVSKIDLEITNIGCYVIVDQVIKKHENGSMDIFVKGIERFEIITRSFHHLGYLEAAVSLYDDAPDEEKNLFFVEEALQKFKGIINKASIELENSFWNNLETAEIKSFKLAEKSGLNLKQQQAILNSQSENKRIEFLLEHFKKVEAYIEKSKVISELIAGDGYLN